MEIYITHRMVLSGICPKTRYCRDGNRIYQCRPENGRHSTYLFPGSLKIRQLNLIHALPCLRYGKSTRKPRLISYPHNHITLGEDLRRRRMDLNMSQAAVARSLGVVEDCVTYWENHRSEPKVSNHPPIVVF